MAASSRSLEFQTGRKLTILSPARLARLPHHEHLFMKVKSAAKGVRKAA
jgi:ribosomal 50S subunit-associated protein YjgA (DUF615 family)